MSDVRIEGFAKALAEVERRLQEVEADLARVRRSARRGEIKLSTFEELKADGEAERAQLLDRKANLEASLEQTRHAQSSVEDWAATMGRVDVWNELDVPSQREILYGLLRNVVIFKPKGSDQPPEIEFIWEAP
jgi:uncharacterized protein (DUF342 family)